MFLYWTKDVDNYTKKGKGKDTTEGTYVPVKF